MTHLLSKNVYKGMMPAVLCSHRSTVFIPENSCPLLYSDTFTTAARFLSVLKKGVFRLYQDTCKYCSLIQDGLGHLTKLLLN